MLPSSFSLAMWLFATSFFVPLSQDPAQQPAKPHDPRPAGDVQTGPAAPSPEKKDPFAVDTELEKLLESRPDGFEPLDERPALPRMKLEGYLEMEGGGAAAAAVEIDGIGTYIAHKDSKIAFSIAGRFNAPAASVPQTANARTNRPTATATATRVVVRDSFPIILLVKDVTPEGVLVEIGTLGETMVIR